MTREEAKGYLPIIQALADGKTVQNYNSVKERWEDISDPAFIVSPNRYRIKPEPTYRPFRDVNECLEEMNKHHPVGWIKSSSGILFNIFEIGEHYIVIAKKGVIGYETAIDDFVFADGTPFGIKEEE